MTNPLESKIRDALRSVQWEGSDIVSNGMFMGATFSPEEKGVKANIVIQVDPQNANGLDALEELVKKAAANVDDVAASNIIFTAHQEAHDHAHEEHDAHDEHSACGGAAKKLHLPNIKNIVAVASGKGGVGKSTTAVNLAAAFAAKGLNAGLLDLDVYGPSVPRMMGIEGEPYTDDNDKIVPHKKGGLEVMSMGFLVDENAPVIWRGPMVHGAITQLFRDVAWGQLDILVVDLPPGTGDAQISLVQNVPMSGAVIVSTPQDVALQDARKGLSMFQRTDVPILGLIENMSYFECPHCKERTDIFGHGGVKTEAEKLHLPFLGEIPIDTHIRQNSDEGKPLTLSDPDSTIAKQYRAIADKIWDALNA